MLSFSEYAEFLKNFEIVIFGKKLSTQYFFAIFDSIKEHSLSRILICSLVGLVFFILYHSLSKHTHQAATQKKNKDKNKRTLQFLKNVTYSAKAIPNKTSLTIVTPHTGYAAFIRFIESTAIGREIATNGLMPFLHEISASLLISSVLFIYFGPHITLFPPSILFIILILLSFASANLLVEKYRYYKKNSFIKLFPNTLDVFKRSLQAGLSINKAFEIATKDSPKIISLLFKQIYEKLRLGMHISDAMNLFAKNSNIDEFKFFAVTLSIHSEAGGNIIETLSNLSNIIRKRTQLNSKIKALSSEARMTGYILIVLPFIISAAIIFLNPEHMNVFFNNTIGKNLLAITCSIFSIGVIIMFRITHIKV